MKYFVIILAAMIAASCSPQKQIMRLKAKGYLEETVNTTPPDTITEIQWDTVRVPILPDADTTEFILDLSQYELWGAPPVFASTELCEAVAEVSEGELVLIVEQKEANIPVPVENITQIIRDTVTIRTNVPTPIEPKNYSFFKSGFWILSGIILLLIIALTVILIRVFK